MSLLERQQSARHRLSEAEKADRELSGDDFQTQITDLAELYGWEWAHFRAARTTKGWRVPVSGALGKGWPDLILTHSRLHKALFVEVKRELEDLRPEQRAVLETLAAAGLFVAVWRPSDLTAGRIAALLAG